MLSFEVGKHNYQASNLDVFDQALIAKGLTPAIKSVLSPDILVAIMGARKTIGADAGKIDFSQIGFATYIPAICDAYHSMSDEDVLAIIKKVMKVVQRQNEGGGVWSNVLSPQGSFMFDDIDLPDMIQIIGRIIWWKIESFFSTAP
jgi:hypothetical protein